MAIETHEIPVISTAHLTREVSETLSQYNDKNQWCACASWQFGYFLYLDELEEDAPKCLEDICEWLKENNFTDCWVRLDGSASEVETLPTYEW